jgi:hypothetical protein
MLPNTATPRVPPNCCPDWTMPDATPAFSTGADPPRKRRDRFAFGLETILDGLQARLAAVRA